jgi:histidinol dehydrogenase
MIAPSICTWRSTAPSGCWTSSITPGRSFLGNYSPVALGDYVAGPSHVLPTGGTARWAAGLSANSFLRAGSIIAYNEPALRRDAIHVQRMAEKEGLTAHRASVDRRVANGE